MTKRLALISACLLSSLLAVSAGAAAQKTPKVEAKAAEPDAKAQYKIVTASERGTYIVLGRDLATWIAPDADIELESVPSAGSTENVFRLRYEPGVKLAMVQSDVYQAFLDQAAAGNKEAGRLIHPLRVVLPLYNEEIYFVVRADSPLNYVHEIKDARINAGPLGSGTALTTLTLYQAMFHAPLPKATTTYLSNEDALLKLTGDKSVDVVAIIAGQPAKLLADMKPEAKDLIRLLKVDPNQPASKEALKTYFPATVYARNYPNLLNDDVPALAVKAFLVTYDFNLQETRKYLARFAKSLCQNFSLLQEKGHPKWKDVELALPELGAGWAYYPVTAKEISACRSARKAQPYTQPQYRGSCTPQETVLGLCTR